MESELKGFFPKKKVINISICDITVPDTEVMKIRRASEFGVFGEKFLFD